MVDICWIVLDKLPCELLGGLLFSSFLYYIHRNWVVNIDVDTTSLINWNFHNFLEHWCSGDVITKELLVGTNFWLVEYNLYRFQLSPWRIVIAKLHVALRWVTIPNDKKHNQMKAIITWEQSHHPEVCCRSNKLLVILAALQENWFEIIFWSLYHCIWDFFKQQWPNS